MNIAAEMTNAGLLRLGKKGFFFPALFGLLVVLACSDRQASAGDFPEPGDRFRQRLEDLPPPYASPSKSNPPEKVARPQFVRPLLPPGFKATLFAEDLEHPRNLVIAPDGDVILVQSRPGSLHLLRDSDGDGTADVNRRLVRGFSTPHGIHLGASELLLADLEGLWALDYDPANDELGKRRLLSKPGAFGRPGGHWTRNIALHPDGRRAFIAIGSRGNIAEEPLPRASIQVLDLESGRMETFASGLRNPVGVAFAPGSGRLFTVVNERDGMGDELVPDYLTEVREGAFYGWPYAYLGPFPQPGFGEKRPDLVAATVTPDLLFQSHSAPLGLAFNDGPMFPEAYRGDAFVALHGSWNAGKPRGYMVVRVPFEEGRPVGAYEAFATGFWVAGQDRAQVWGRPAGLTFGPDGALFVADDAGGTLWRITYEGG